MKCQACSAENREGRKFCAGCGAPLAVICAACTTRLWRYQGKRTEARALLAPVYATFTEGFATRDLIDAKALLDDLA